MVEPATNAAAAATNNVLFNTAFPKCSLLKMVPKALPFNRTEPVILPKNNLEICDGANRPRA